MYFRIALRGPNMEQIINLHLADPERVLEGLGILDSPVDEHLDRPIIVTHVHIEGVND